jgi:hypothetical protein
MPSAKFGQIESIIYERVPGSRKERNPWRRRHRPRKPFERFGANA